MLKRDETLKVYAKGRYGESIEEIEAKNIPINAKSKLLAMRYELYPHLFLSKIKILGRGILCIKKP